MKKKILIIEDSKTQLRSIKLILTKAGYDTITAGNGHDGICMAYETMPDLIVSDILMPEINGYQLCRLLKNDPETKHIPIILLTVLNKKLDKFWGIAAGADSFVIKDDDFVNLLSELTKFLEHMTPPQKERRNSYGDKNSLTNSGLQTKINDILDQALTESTIMNEFRNLSEFVLDSKVLNKGIFTLISSILDYNVAGIFFNDMDEKKDKLLNLSIQEASLSDEISEQLKNDFFESVFLTSHPNHKDFYKFEIFEKDISNLTSVNNISQFQSKIIIPIMYANKVIGGICLYYLNNNKTASSKIFNIIFEELKILMRIKWLYSETRFLAITDGLTGLYNRRYFQQMIDIEFARSKRYCSDLSIALFDIDHFKRVNDTYGHQFGDKVLAEISKIIQNFLRKTDYVARYGGEEFIAVLPETDLTSAMIPMERLRQAIESHSFKYGNESIKVTVSIGISAVTPDILLDDELIKRADQALYLAKQNGRNRVEYYNMAVLS